MRTKKVTFSSRRSVFLVERFDNYNGRIEYSGEKKYKNEKKDGDEKKHYTIHYIGDVIYKLYKEPENYFIKTHQVGIILFSACEDEVLLFKRGGVMKLFYDSDIDFEAAVFKFSSILKIDPQNTNYIGATNDGDITFFVFMLKDVTPYYVMTTKRTKSCFQRHANVCFVQLDLIKNNLEQYGVKFDEKTIKNCERAKMMLKYSGVN